MEQTCKSAFCKPLFLGALILILNSLTLHAEQRVVRGKQTDVSPRAAETFLNLQRTIRPASFRIQSAIQVEGNIAVVPADPELLILSNTFDLQHKTIHFQPALQGKYLYTQTIQPFDGTISDALQLSDDASAEVVFTNFAFPFGKKTYDRCFVNSNGNLTFQKADTDPPNADNITGGPPRIAAFFSDLDPEQSGTVFINQTSDRVVISWLRVPEFFNQNMFDYGQNTFQIILHSDGGIDLVYDELSATQGIVGIISAGKSPLHLVDFSNNHPSNRPLKSFLENFHDYESIDISALMKGIYQDVPDKFDFVTLFSNFDLTPVPGAQAFAINVRNNIQGIGNPNADGLAVFNNIDRYGSERRLQNITFLGNIHNYPDDFSENLAETQTSTLAILAHEVGHRWLSYIKYPKDGSKSNVLIGRDQSHWSFFFNSNASFLEGNDIQPQSSTSFSTGAPFRRYSPLDLYLMGLISPSEVDDSFYVDAPSDFAPDFTFSKDSEPETDVRFNGVPIKVTMDDIVAANGPRKPGVATSQKQFRHLFVLIVKNETPPTAEDLSRLDLLRLSWEHFFNQATGKKATVSTSIR